MTKDKTQVQGALTKDDTPDSAALALLVKRIEEQQRLNRLMETNMRAMQQALTEQNQELQEVLRQQQEDRVRSAQALAAALEKMQTILEQRPTDPITVAKMIEVQKREAQEQAAKKQALLREKLKKMPRGRVYNPNTYSVPITINGFQVILQPEWNENIPQIFIEGWEKHLAVTKQMQGEIQALQGLVDYGTMEDFRFGSKTVGGDATQQVWDADTGFAEVS